ncbi:hypothetical protein PSEHALCIP103_00946 [Pseudoalteromonas haloplanktis]|jgi:uncharacterized protein (DUF1778 family)|uniref:DUF1778 domain-containing protein n=1 Tax=Pseudoalteromonas haloplanktis TaxID=228 RepID=A0A9W4QUS8_PSEHA|nr:DUF1778 domain-containing protein [Pseudoalteromonas haloplanktis]PHQ93996.1 MAG: hypothetical protein COB48_06535 [Pseudoalteromonas sp.]CAH9054031.1 hypothetical protein PSEHALCIP103_00946 [Pseudoalteromonas haloplanktis]
MSTFTNETDSNKSARLDLKTNHELKSMLEDAAVFSGTSLTGFILAAAADKAREVMNHHNNTVLSSAAWAKLNAVIENSSREVTPGMKALFKKERRPNGDPI